MKYKVGTWVKCINTDHLPASCKTNIFRVADPKKLSKYDPDLYLNNELLALIGPYPDEYKYVQSYNAPYVEAYADLFVAIDQDDIDAWVENFFDECDEEFKELEKEIESFAQSGDKSESSKNDDNYDKCENCGHTGEWISGAMKCPNCWKVW